MKVTISKNIDVSEIPIEIIQAFQEAAAKLGALSKNRSIQINKCLYSNNEEQFFQSLLVIDEYRKELAEFDNKLQECYNIITGYKDIIEQPKQESTQDIDDKAAEIVNKYEDLLNNLDLDEEEDSGEENE